MKLSKRLKLLPLTPMLPVNFTADMAPLFRRGAVELRKLVREGVGEGNKGRTTGGIGIGL